MYTRSEERGPAVLGARPGTPIVRQCVALVVQVSHPFHDGAVKWIGHPAKMRLRAVAATVIVLALLLTTHGIAAQQAPESRSTAAAAAIAGSGVESEWTLDRIHSRIGFSVSHFTITQVTGYFQDFDAHVLCACPAEDFTGGTVEFVAKTASVFTDNAERDGHLRTDSFFAAAKYPEMRFTGTLVKVGGKNLLKGNLTIRDVTRPVVFDVTYGGRIKDRNLGIEKAGFKITGKVNRLDYGLRWNERFEGGGAIVGEEVTIDINAEIDRKKPDARTP